MVISRNCVNTRAFSWRCAQFLADRGQALEFAAMFGRVIAGTKELGGVVADLFELHELGQDKPSPLDAVGGLELLGEIANGLFVEGRLVPAQGTEGGHLDFLRKVRDHSLIGLEPPQDVRPDQAAERLVRRSRLHLLDEIGERLGTAEEAWIEKVEQRPEIGQAIFDGSSRHGDPGRRLEVLDRSRLPSARILDRLGFIKDDEVPFMFAQPR